MSISDKAFEKYFKTKNQNNFTSKGIWIIKLHLSECFGWEWDAKNFEELCINIDLSNWYQLRDITDSEVLKVKQINKDKEVLKVTRSSVVING